MPKNDEIEKEFNAHTQLNSIAIKIAFFKRCWTASESIINIQWKQTW